jgi:hypothetical protein
MKIAATTLAGFITVEERRAKKDIFFGISSSMLRHVAMSLKANLLTNSKLACLNQTKTTDKVSISRNADISMAYKWVC